MIALLMAQNSKRLMKRIRVLALLGFFLSLPQAYGQDGSSNSSSTGAQNQSQSQNDANKKKNKKDSDEVAFSTTFSDAVAQEVLQRLTDGLEGHSERRLLSVFDDNKMDGYLNFEAQIGALFDRYESFRVHFRIAEATTEGDKGIVLVDIEIEEIPRSGDAQAVRKSDQMRFEMERGKKGWKIVDLRPRAFFS